jgi:ABC-type nitrate/sulfonate/bicarbonate transport system ATPase subunit
MSSEVLRCESLGKAFNGKKVLESFEMSLSEGEVAGIVGPSGCGKTTILRLIAGLEEASEGRVHGGGRNKRIAFAFQEPRLIPWFTAEQNVDFVLRELYPDKTERRRRTLEALEAVELSSAFHLYPDQLSGGMKQRVALARAFAYDPDVLLMDEPFAGLDFPLRMQMIDFFNELLKKSRMAVLFVSHDTREIMHIADRVCILNGSPCSIREVLHLRDKSDRHEHPGYIQKMEEHMLEVMMQEREK